jgi:hypothetical protein
MMSRRAIGPLAVLLALLGPPASVGAALSPGNPVTVGVPLTFSGVGGTNASGGAHSALSAFEAAIGGANNGGNPPPQMGGFRTINWDGVALDGGDFGGNTVVIATDKTVGIPLNRFESRGVFFEEVYAVSGDGFATVNPGAAGLFPAFSPSNTFAMFNDNSIDLRFVLAASPDTTPVPAATRGLGVIFRNVRTLNGTAIEYFNGALSLGKFFVPVSASSGDAEFLGVLFDDPIVTNVTITCGTDTLFNFDGATFSAGSTDSPPTHNLVVTDDFVYAEPTTAANAVPGITATAGTQFTGTVASFTDSSLGATASEFTAIIDWGDAHISPGTVKANASAGFDVSGSHTYDDAGTFSVRTDVADFGGATLSVVTTAAVAAASTTTTTTTLPCADGSLAAVACLLAEVPPMACAGQTLPARLTALYGAARSLVDRARNASGRQQRKLLRKAVAVLGRAAAAVGLVHDVSGACPAALAGLFADARARAEGVITAP